ncbi:hypothetical protein [Catenulispora sp. GAS73]|uniref:hypothetical protein n=1 Tax=Catenulispora sp. GAS73 TaxID=3156269 RepID=UPI0035154B7F
MEASDAAEQVSPDLRHALGLIADEVVSAPHSDMLPQVMARATRIRRRRRVLRAGSATAVLVVAALLGPSIASELGARGGDASAAPPPSAIEDLTSAYPMPTALQDDKVVAATPALPANALPWPSRGTPVPAQAAEVAKSYLLNQVGRSAATGTKAATTATVAPLWSQVDADTTTQASTGHGGAAKTAPQSTYKTWLYVMQGWTTGADGVPSQAQLLVGDYTQTGKGSSESSSMSVYAAPVTFAHARPGSSDDADDAQQIAELSVYLPQSDRLVVLGAPQTKTVLYAKTGGDLIPQKTDDGVAVFPRTHRLVKGRYADTIQVRDANNVALTPPKAWSAGDYQLTGGMGLWKSGAAGWVMVPPRGVGGMRGTATPGPTAGPTAGPSAEPSDAGASGVGASSTAPPVQAVRPTAASSASAASSSGTPSTASAPVPAPPSSGGGNGSGTPSADLGAAAGSGGGVGFPSSF